MNEVQKKNTEKKPAFGQTLVAVRLYFDAHDMHPVEKSFYKA
jgi:hypothetical protein